MPQKSTTPSKQHKPKPKPKTSKTSDCRPKINGEQVQLPESSDSLPKTIQQSILSTFVEALSLTSSSQTHLQSTIQSVKSALYARDFTKAFDSEDFRRAYCARWSPSRSLAYAQLLRQEDNQLDAGVSNWDIVCLGGGAGAEFVGLTVAWASLQDGHPEPLEIDLHIIDAANWTTEIEDLNRCLPVNQSQGHGVKFDFHQMDLLDEGIGEKLHPLLKSTNLVTIFFTLNELYAASLGRTTQFLLEIGDAVRPGAKLCVVDSAGSYAGVVFDQEDGTENRKEDNKNQSSNKRYPMAWMLDHTLLQLSGKNKDKKVWRKILGDESRWFRRDKTLEYPLPLEDMRYQIHIFERLDDGKDD